MELKKMLVRMMERRGLSRAGLAYALGYKSVTSVTRVMEGACGRESAGECQGETRGSISVRKIWRAG